MLQRHQQGIERSQQFIDKAEALREDHPEMGCRKMALKLKQPGSGRDKTEALLLRSGFRVIYPPNYIKTTHSVRIRQFGNLIEGLVVTSINKVVQTDSYLSVGERPVLLFGFNDRCVFKSYSGLSCKLRFGS